MKKHPTTIFAAALAGLGLAWPSGALAAQPGGNPGETPPPIAFPHQGRRPHIRPPHRRHVAVESTQVSAQLVDGIATTRVKFRLRNHSRSPAEKILLLPIPAGASADGLELWIGGKPEKGEVLDKDKARGIYQSIVSRRQDPALLEYVDRSTLRLRVFPVPAQGTQDVEVRYRMLLPSEGAMRRWEFPCRALESGKFSIDLEIRSKKAIKNVWSPMQGFDIQRKGDYKARASYESASRPGRDPVIFYGLSDRDFGLDLVTYRDGQSKEDGYFVALLAPKRDWKNEKPIRKSIHFVLDTSGSMGGPKIEQARAALRYFLQSLRPEDFFNVVPFSTEARPFYDAPACADADRVKDALAKAEELEARGGTNIGDALTHALRAPVQEGCVPIVVFLTDGLATVGTTAVQELLKEIGRANAHKARVFVFGVGHDVNTRLLDTVAENTRGTRDYVKPGENLEVKTSALFEKLAHPVMTDLELVADGVRLERMVPRRLPDLFRGSHVVVAGRYKGSGPIALRLRGKTSNESKVFVYDANFPAHATENDFVATLWAQRRIGQLVDIVRLQGQKAELVAEIKRLGKEHGIVTPWTSQLVVEESARLADAGGVPADRLRFARGRAKPRAGAPAPRGPGGPSTPGAASGAPSGSSRVADRLGEIATARADGRKAVLASKLTKAMTEMRVLKDLDADSVEGKDRAGPASRRIGKRVFHRIGGYWVDSKLTAELAKTQRKVVAFSPEYFALLAKHRELAPVFAFATEIIVVVDGVVIHVTKPAKRAKPGETPQKGR